MIRVHKENIVQYIYQELTNDLKWLDNHIEAFLSTNKKGLLFVWILLFEQSADQVTTQTLKIFRLCTACADFVLYDKINISPLQLFNMRLIISS